MIFEIETMKLKETIANIRKLYTSSELNKKETSWIEIKVESNLVTLSSNRNEPFPFQIQLKDAKPIFEGKLRVLLNDLHQVLKSFNKDSGILLIEQNGDELRFDDGVYEPEIILVNEENFIDNVYSLDPPTFNCTVKAAPLMQSLQMAKQIIRTTFLPSTKFIALDTTLNEFFISSFNLTEMYRARIRCLSEPLETPILLAKSEVSRLEKWVSLFDKPVRLSKKGKWLYAFCDDFLVAFPIIGDEEAEAIYRILPFEKMKQVEKSITMSFSEWKKMLRTSRGIELGSVTFEWVQHSLKMVDPHDKTWQFPYKTLKNTLKWPLPSVQVGQGLVENGRPLVFESRDADSEQLYIQTGFEDFIDRDEFNNITLQTQIA